MSRVFPRLAAHDVPDLVTVPALTHMLLDGAVAERYAVRYAHYFLQRVFEHHGRADLAASHPDARDAVAALTKCAKEGTGARQLLATRALVAAARAGVPEARDALDDAVAAPSPPSPPESTPVLLLLLLLRRQALRLSLHLRPGRRDGPRRPRRPRRATPTAPSTARRPRRLVRPRRALRSRSNPPPGPDPGAGASAASSSHSAHVPAAAIATAAASTDIIVVRHAWAAALRGVATDGAEDDVATLADALEPVVDARARAFAARASAAAGAPRGGRYVARGGE